MAGSSITTSQTETSPLTGQSSLTSDIGQLSKVLEVGSNQHDYHEQTMVEPRPPLQAYRSSSERSHHDGQTSVRQYNEKGLEQSPIRLGSRRSTDRPRKRSNMNTRSQVLAVARTLLPILSSIPNRSAPFRFLPHLSFVPVLLARMRPSRSQFLPMLRTRIIKHRQDQKGRRQKDLRGLGESASQVLYSRQRNPKQSMLRLLA